MDHAVGSLACGRMLQRDLGIAPLSKGDDWKRVSRYPGDRVACSQDCRNRSYRGAERRCENGTADVKQAEQAARMILHDNAHGCMV